MKDYLALICGSPGTLDSTWQYLGTRISIMISRDRINFYTELCVNKYRLINLLMPKIVRSKYEPQYRANTEASRHKSHGIFQESQQPYMVLPIEQHGLVLRTVVATTFSVHPLACSNFHSSWARCLGAKELASAWVNQQNLWLVQGITFSSFGQAPDVPKILGPRAQGCTAQATPDARQF